MPIWPVLGTVLQCLRRGLGRSRNAGCPCPSGPPWWRWATPSATFPERIF